MVLAEILLDKPGDFLTLELDMEPNQIEELLAYEGPEWYVKQYGRDAFFSIPKNKYLISWVVPEDEQRTLTSK